jgi:uncharacterized membrane protein YkoI
MIRLISVTAAIVLTLPFTVWGAAKEPKTPDNTPKGQPAAMLKQATLSLDDVVHRAREKTSGQPVKVELQRKDDKVVWKVTMLAERNVQHIYVDAYDGSFLVLLVPVAPAHSESQ